MRKEVGEEKQSNKKAAKQMNLDLPEAAFRDLL